jgi:hypothetical protein
VILGVFGFGFENISLAVADYYKFDKITNIERVYPESVTFPAIIFCTSEKYRREHFVNGSLIKEDIVSTNLLKQFVNFEYTDFYSFKNKTQFSVSNNLDTFKIMDPISGLYYDYLRFNAVTNRSSELFKATSVLDYFRICFNKIYREDISQNEYINYTLTTFFFIYVSDNSLELFENLKYLWLEPEIYYGIEIEKESIESKLPEPYNHCKESSVGDPYHQINCIEACTYKEIKNKYNCTFHLTLFSIQGFSECVLEYNILKDEFSASCRKECPLESCFSEKFVFDSTSLYWEPDYTSFRFKFRDLSSINITQIPKTDPFTFLNNIGGGLGLFMGIAFPNLIELFQFILEIVLIIFIRKIN